jgi:hypothetical protein
MLRELNHVGGHRYMEKHNQGYPHSSITHLEIDNIRLEFEPPTSCTAGRRSTKELFEQLIDLLTGTSTVPV